jgi:hypothetical protein
MVLLSWHLLFWQGVYREENTKHPSADAGGSRGLCAAAVCAVAVDDQAFSAAGISER